MGKSTFSRVQLAGDKGLGRLRIHRECVARRASALGHPGYDQRAPGCPDGHLDRVPCPNELRGLYTLAVQVYATPKDRPGRRAAGLEHARCPEPFVDPHLIHCAMIAVARALPADRRPRARSGRAELAPSLPLQGDDPNEERDDDGHRYGLRERVGTCDREKDAAHDDNE